MQTIIYSSNPDEPYRVELDAPPSAGPTGLDHVPQAIALTIAGVAAELALGYVERRFLQGRPVASNHARRVRNGALSTLTGAFVVLAEQSFAPRAGQWR
jgi:hypothetical protein